MTPLFSHTHCGASRRHNVLSKFEFHNNREKLDSGSQIKGYVVGAKLSATTTIFMVHNTCRSVYGGLYLTMKLIDQGPHPGLLPTVVYINAL